MVIVIMLESRRKVILTEEWKNNIGKTLGFGCIIDGIEYRSIKQAYISLNLSYRIIRKRIDSEEYSNYCFC